MASPADLRLSELTIEMPRPGVIYLTDQRTGRKKAVGFFCHDCLSTNMKVMDYRVENEFWRQHVPEDGFLCFPCLQKRVPEGTPIPIFEAPGRVKPARPSSTHSHGGPHGRSRP